MRMLLLPCHPWKHTGIYARRDLATLETVTVTSIEMFVNLIIPYTTWSTFQISEHTKWKIS